MFVRTHIRRGNDVIGGTCPACAIPALISVDGARLGILRARPRRSSATRTRAPRTREPPSPLTGPRDLPRQFADTGSIRLCRHKDVVFISLPCLRAETRVPVPLPRPPPKAVVFIRLPDLHAVRRSRAVLLTLASPPSLSSQLSFSGRPHARRIYKLHVRPDRPPLGPPPPPPPRYQLETNERDAVRVVGSELARRY